MGIFNDLIADLRHPRRLFRDNLGFSLVAVGSIALGIGASSAIFSLVHVVLFDPYKDSRIKGTDGMSRLVPLWHSPLR
ncbi:MAG TPA: hypothetical protein VML01_09475 [Bryobacterales bacterium]|nr:hypothetical protein [Bryobacterales bacterium]